MHANSLLVQSTRGAVHNSSPSMDETTEMGFHWGNDTTDIPEPSKHSSQSSHATKVFHIDGLFEAFQYAKMINDSCDIEKLKSAFSEAVGFLTSGIFSEYQRPNISVDQYGEFSFSIGSEVGYLDVGVSGDNTISYHVRNDREPGNSVYGDDEWDGRIVPDKLLESTILFLND